MVFGVWCFGVGGASGSWCFHSGAGGVRRTTAPRCLPTGINPDEAVAYGATVQAAVIAGKDEIQDKVSSSDPFACERIALFSKFDICVNMGSKKDEIMLIFFRMEWFLVFEEEMLCCCHLFSYVSKCKAKRIPEHPPKRWK